MPEQGDKSPETIGHPLAFLRPLGERLRDNWKAIWFGATAIGVSAGIFAAMPIYFAAPSSLTEIAVIKESNLEVGATIIGITLILFTSVAIADGLARGAQRIASAASRFLK